MIKDTHILNKVKSGDRVIIRDYIGGQLIADDVVEKILHGKEYQTGLAVYVVGIENGCLLLEVCE